MDVINSIMPFLDPLKLKELKDIQSEEAERNLDDDSPLKNEDAGLADKPSVVPSTDVIVDLQSPAESSALNSPPTENTSTNPLISRVTALYDRLQAETIQDTIKPANFMPEDTIRRRTEISQTSLSEFDLVMRTAEGDVINLSIYQNSSRYAAENFDGEKGIYQQGNFISTRSGLDFTIQGDLNAEEQAALTNFLEDITTLTDAFLDFDLPSLLNAVDDLTLSPELAGFALNLKSVYTERITQEITTAPSLSNANAFNPAQALGKPLSAYAKNSLSAPANPLTQSNILEAYTRNLLDDAAALMAQAEEASERFKEKFENQFLEKLPNFISDQFFLNSPYLKDD